MQLLCMYSVCIYAEEILVASYLWSLATLIFQPEHECFCVANAGLFLKKDILLISGEIELFDHVIHIP